MSSLLQIPWISRGWSPAANHFSILALRTPWTLDGRESEWTLGVGDGQGSLECCNSWGGTESDMTERLNWILNCVNVTTTTKSRPTDIEDKLVFISGEGQDSSMGLTHTNYYLTYVSNENILYGMRNYSPCFIKSIIYKNTESLCYTPENNINNIIL